MGLPTFGEKIKKARKDAGLTKQKVAQLLSIQVKYLERLEAGEIEKLPPHVYLKGFLRKYEKVLALEPESLIRDFEKELEIAGISKIKSFKTLPELRPRWLTITPKTLAYVFGLIIVVFLVSYLVYQLNILIGPPKLVLFEPSQNISTGEYALIFKGQTTPGVKLTINGQETNIDRNGNFEQKINLSQGLNIINLEAVNRFNKKASLTREILVR